MGTGGSKEAEHGVTIASVPDVSNKAHEELQRASSKPTSEYIPVAKEEASKFPHMFEVIIKQADDHPSDHNSLLNKIRSSGIFLNKNKQKYWIDEKTGANCFMMFARSLLITWSENENLWQWAALKETSNVEVEIASLLNVCWLEIHGRFDTSYLTPGVMYEVVFVVRMELGYGWAKPVNLRLKLPNGEAKQHEECLLEVAAGRWVELRAGEFMAERTMAGEMEFSLYEYEGGQWKRGLTVKGAIIRPVKN